MDVFVPFAAHRPKTRLSGTFTIEERRAFADAMLGDVLTAVQAAGGSPTVLADRPIDLTTRVGAEVATDVAVRVDDRDLSPAVNAALADAVSNTPDDAVAVVMSDLGIATPDSLRRLFAADGDVVIAPGRGGGTNALVVRDPAFRVDYHGVSLRDHRRIAADVGATVTELDSHRLASDVDERGDLTEVLLHGSGAARRWLVDAGFEPSSAAEARAGVRRRTDD
ncbi:2-phospho-L-lactate guanylyltransferase [Halopenitus sp. POP-27]|uniref:2-phospho-L-lactate guanylyltransferase n=1 Tax=Halopenitus sp. POP-27 TaxID=2994425 RepID=UPI00246944CE|nr:2-phospho-L-lactate guanylyltransferase [Halopenitus sp. POP-27]